MNPLMCSAIIKQKIKHDDTKSHTESEKHNEHFVYCQRCTYLIYKWVFMLHCPRHDEITVASFAQYLDLFDLYNTFRITISKPAEELLRNLSL